MRTKIVKGRIFNHRDGQAEPDRFIKEQEKRKRVRRCRCKMCKDRTAWIDLGK